MTKASKAPRGQKVGYIRVSSVDQNTERQLDGIELDKVFTDKASGKDTNRPQLQAALDHLREGDELVTHSMDRLSRNLEDMRRLVRELTDRGVTVRFVKEGMAFTGDDSPMNQLLLSMLGAVAEFERSMIRERQREGIAIAKAKGGVFKGRKPTLDTGQVVTLQEKVAAGASKAAVAREFGVSRQTLYEYLKKPLEAVAGREDMAHRQALEKRGQGRLV
jgi:DNA invertase Pin-like site-specific DNA recombinase